MPFTIAQLRAYAARRSLFASADLQSAVSQAANRGAFLRLFHCPFYRAHRSLPSVAERRYALAA